MIINFVTAILLVWSLLWVLVSLGDGDVVQCLYSALAFFVSFYTFIKKINKEDEQEYRYRNIYTNGGGGYDGYGSYDDVYRGRYYRHTNNNDANIKEVKNILKNRKNNLIKVLNKDGSTADKHKR